MRAKREKTEFGSVKAVVPRKKNVSYGDVVAPIVTHGKESEEEELPSNAVSGNQQQGESSPGAQGSSSDEIESQGEPQSIEQGEGGSKAQEELGKAPKSLAEQLSDMLEMMNKADEARKEREDKEAEEKQEAENAKDDEKQESEDGSEEEEKESSDKDKQKDKQNEQKKEDEDLLTKYLVLQMRIRALGEVFGSIKVSEKDKEYYSYVAIQGQLGYLSTGYNVGSLIPEDGTIFPITVPLPVFETKEKAEDFLELCGDMLLEYGKLAFSISAQAIAVLPIKVIHM